MFLFLPFILLPIISAYIFNRVNYKYRGLTFVVTGILLVIYFIIFQIVKDYYDPPKEYRCGFPAFVIPILLFPLVALYQFFVNKIIIKEVKYK